MNSAKSKTKVVTDLFKGLTKDTSKELLTSPRVLGSDDPAEDDVYALFASVKELSKKATKEGYLTKQGGSVRSLKKRYFVLFENKLYYFENEDSKEAIGLIVLEIRKCCSRSDQETGEKFSMKIRTAERNFYCFAENETLIEGWIGAINAAVWPTPSRHLRECRLSGWVKKKSKSLEKQIWKDRYLALNNGCLYIYREMKDGIHKGEYILRGCTIARADNAFNGRPTLEIVPTIASSSSVNNNNNNNNNQKVIKTLTIQSEFEDIDIWEICIREQVMAFSNITAVTASSSNDLLRKHSNSDWKTADMIIHKGPLEMDVAKKLGFKNVYCVLKGTVLCVFNKQTSAETAEPDLKLELRGRIIAKIDKEVKVPYTFKVESSGATDVYYFKGASDEDVEQWVSKMKELCRTEVSRNLSKSGWLTKQGGGIKTWKKRYFVLKNNELYYYGDPSDAEAKGKIEVFGIQVRQLTSKEARDETGDKFKYVIEVLHPDRTWILASDTQQDCMEWNIVIRQASMAFTGVNVLHVDPYSFKQQKNYFKTITDAIANSSRLDRIVIHRGEYNEELMIRKALILETDGAGEVIVVGSRKPALTVNMSGCVILKGITLVQAGSGDLDCVMLKSGNAHFENCVIEAKVANAVNCGGMSHLSMNSCRIIQSKQYGISVSSQSAALIENCIITNSQWDGVMLLGEAEGIIRSCSISTCSYNGISINTDGRVTVEHCSVFDNQWDGISVKNSKSSCTFYNNKIYHNKGFGIYYASSSNPTSLASFKKQSSS